MNINSKIALKGNYGITNQVLVSNGSSNSISWANQTDTTYSAGTGVSISNSNQISIGQAVGTNNNVTFNSINILGSGSQNNRIGTTTIYNSTITGNVDETNNGYIEINRLKKLTGQGRTGLTLENSTGGGGEDTRCRIQLGHSMKITTENIDEPGNSTRGNIDITAGDGNITFTAGGNVQLSNGNTVTSDNRIKHNEINITNGLNIIRKLIPQKYQKTKEMYEEFYNGDISGNYKIESGFIAQEILKIEDLSYCVSGGDYIDENSNYIKNQYYLAYQDIFVYGIAATKELDGIVQNQQTIINDLKAENTLIKQENNLIKSKLNEILLEMGRETI